MDEASVDEVRQAIKDRHACDARWLESVRVVESVVDDVVWEGEVQVFELLGHPEATRAYAWSHVTNHGKRRVFTVLGVGSVKDAVTAVRASVARPAR